MWTHVTSSFDLFHFSFFNKKKTFFWVDSFGCVELNSCKRVHWRGEAYFLLPLWFLFLAEYNERKCFFLNNLNHLVDTTSGGDLMNTKKKFLNLFFLIYISSIPCSDVIVASNYLRYFSLKFHCAVIYKFYCTLSSLSVVKERLKFIQFSNEISPFAHQFRCA